MNNVMSHEERLALCNEALVNPPRPITEADRIDHCEGDTDE